MCTNKYKWCIELLSPFTTYMHLKNYVQAKLSCGSRFPLKKRTLMGWGDHLDHGEGKVNHQIPITVENVRAQKSHKKYAMKLQRLIIFISFLVTINYIGDMKRLALGIGSGAHRSTTTEPGPSDIPLQDKERFCCHSNNSVYISSVQGWKEAKQNSFPPLLHWNPIHMWS